MRVAVLALLALLAASVSAQSVKEFCGQQGCPANPTSLSCVGAKCYAGSSSGVFVTTDAKLSQWNKVALPGSSSRVNSVIAFGNGALAVGSTSSGGSGLLYSRNGAGGLAPVRNSPNVVTSLHLYRSPSLHNKYSAIQTAAVEYATGLYARDSTSYAEMGAVVLSPEGDVRTYPFVDDHATAYGLPRAFHNVRDGVFLYAGGSSNARAAAGVYRSENYGQTWTNVRMGKNFGIQPFDLNCDSSGAVCAAAVVERNDYNLYISTNTGSSWYLRHSINAATRTQMKRAPAGNPTVRVLPISNIIVYAVPMKDAAGAVKTVIFMSADKGGRWSTFEAAGTVQANEIESDEAGKKAIIAGKSASGAGVFAVVDMNGRQ